MPPLPLVGRYSIRGHGSMGSHPTRYVLQAFFRGDLAEDDVALVEEHLANCPICCETADDGETDDHFIHRLRSAVQASPTPPAAVSTHEDPPTVVLQHNQVWIPAPAEVGYLQPPSIPGYDIVRELGRGGMGVVYEARQCALDRRVAIKLLRDAATAEPEDVSRFRDEVLALARLDHPNVVQIFDSGAIAGRPFVVLEYVAGGTLADASRGVPQQPLEAARIIADVARGVEAIHAAGIVHRDLKPSNVLLAPPDRVPKISDFGIAKILDRTSDHTATGLSPGTPKYMSPEQVTNRPITPATDVYAVGVLLYELLTGRTPLDGATAMETFELVRTQEPLPPRWLNRTIPADLDTICMKCLQKDPTTRYPSAAALGDDLRRFLDGRTIYARPVGSIERVVRWCRRNRREAGLIGLVVLLMVTLGAGGLVTSVIFSRNAAEQKQLAGNAEEARKAAVAEQKHAVAEAERATQVTKFLTGLFEPHDELFVGSACLGFRNQKDVGNVSDVLKLGVAKLKGPDGFHDRPLIRADLLYKIGTAYTGLGRAVEAQEMLEESLWLRRTHLPANHPDLGNTVLAVALIRSLLTEEVAEDLFHEAITICKANPDPDGIKLANAEAGYGFLSMAIGGSNDKLLLMERVYAVRRQVLGETNLQTITTLLAIIRNKYEAEEYAEAASLLARLTTALEAGEKNHPLLRSCRLMAETFTASILIGERAALEPARKLVAELTTVVGEHHFLTLQARTLLAAMVTGDERVARFRECLTSVDTWGAPCLFWRAKFTLEIARAHGVVPESAALASTAEREYRVSLDLFRQLAKKKSQARHEYPYTLQCLARLLVSRRNAAHNTEISKLLDEGAEYCRRNPRVVDYRRAISMTDAGHWRLQHGDAATSLELFAEAAQLWRADKRPVGPCFLAEALALQHYALVKLGRSQDAEAVRRECEAAIRRANNDKDTQIRCAKQILAGYLPPWRSLG